jgi:hypothetical protein
MGKRKGTRYKNEFLKPVKTGFVPVDEYRKLSGAFAGLSVPFKLEDVLELRDEILALDVWDKGETVGVLKEVKSNLSKEELEALMLVDNIIGGVRVDRNNKD